MSDDVSRLDKKTINVLLFPCGSEVVAEIYRSLRHMKDVRLFGASSVSDHGEFLFSDRFSEYIGDLPHVDSDEFEKRFISLVNEKSITFIFPGMDSVAAVLKRIEPKFLPCRVLTSPLVTAEMCLSKRATYEALKRLVPCCKQYNCHSEIDFYPIFIKPDVGYGSRGARRIDSSEELLEVMANSNNEMILLEYLPGEEYTVDCFTGSAGELKFVLARERGRVRLGISTHTYPAQQLIQSKCEEIAGKINSNVELEGMWFFQVKEDREGNLAVMEMAVRCGGSSGIDRFLGVNLAKIAIYDALGYEIKVTPMTHQVEVSRGLDLHVKSSIVFDTLYLDFDDCVLLQEKFLNPEIMMLIAQVKNRGKKCVLISRHEGDLDSVLFALGISGLFDSVIHISDDTIEKIDHISGAAVLVDDSFRERQAAIRNGVPAFDIDAVSLLFNSPKYSIERLDHEC